MFSAFLLTKQKNVTGLFRLRRYILAIIQLPLHVRQMSLLGVIYRADIAAEFSMHFKNSFHTQTVAPFNNIKCHNSPDDYSKSSQKKKRAADWIDEAIPGRFWLCLKVLLFVFAYSLEMFLTTKTKLSAASCLEYHVFFYPKY